MKNIQVKKFYDLDELNKWLKDFQGEVFEIQHDYKGVDIYTFLVIYKN
jgi:hypothetical protein